MMKTEEEIFSDIETYVKAQLTDLTGWEWGSPERAITNAIKHAISIIWKLLYIGWKNIFASTADRTGLRRHYEDYGIAWDSPTEDEARAEVLNTMRSKGFGTGPWFEETAVANFDAVDEAHYMNIRANVARLLVLHAGGDVDEDIVADVQAYFDDTSRKIGPLDIEVVTYRDIEDTQALVEGVA